MKTLRTFALLVSTAVLLGLGGCATNLKPKDMLAQFEVGEQVVYVVVPGKPKKLTEFDGFPKICGAQQDETWSQSANEFMTKYVCNNLDKWQLVSGVYHTKVLGLSGGVKFTPALAPASMSIETDDILEFSVATSSDGQKIRPALVKRIARKAKDATKESGCWWDGGKGATTAFIGGGAVCDGWNWRDQKFAKE